MRYRVLGPVEATTGETPVRLGGPKQRLVLAILLIDAGRPVSDDRLVDGVWGTELPTRPRHIVQTYVSELRHLLDDEIRREGTGYRLVIEPEAVDAHRFAALVASARERLADSPAGAAATLREALALWHGPPYADLAQAPVVQPEVQRLEQLRLGAVEDRLHADLDRGRHREVVVELEALTREHPYREGLRGLHMLALYRCGRQADALLVYDRTRELLAEQLGIDPSPELQSLQRRILEQDRGLEHGGDGDPDRPAASVSVPDEGDAVANVVRGFELRERVGAGDHGTTYRAYQASIGREVAVKVIQQPGPPSAGFVRAFEPRTAAVGRLTHPHLVPLLDSWRDQRAAYVVTPWFRTGDARRTLHAGPWSLAATLRLLEQVGGALAAAHEHGVVHGGVKATNVLIDADGTAYLTDFPVVTRPADAVGTPQSATPALVVPEERLGRPLTPLSDVHGLALLAIELLQGSLPASSEPVVALAQARPDLPPSLLEVLDRATASDPSERPGGVRELLRDLRRAAGADSMGLARPQEPGRPVRNPYKGLRAFDEQDAQDFFGREALTHRLVEAVGSQRLVAVVGPSGSGKSSLVRAGLVPALRAGALPGSREWLVARTYPGSYPFEELEAALRRIAVDGPDGMLAELVADDRGLLRVVKQVLPDDDSELLLIVDQFEELFVLTTDPGVRRLFLDSLVALTGDARSRVRTVITMRADFFDRPLEHHAFGELVHLGLVPVTVPAPDELVRAVVQPARRVGVEFEEGLPAQIVRDVADQPGALPLLQHALTEAFAAHEGGVLTAEAYRARGGVEGSLGRRADEVFRSLSPAGQHAAEQVLLRLVSVDEHAEDARRRVRASELTGPATDPAAVDEVIDAFGAHRLLTFDRDPVTRTPTVEVAHEALFREWERLRGWIDARRGDLVLHRRLSAAVAEWVQADRHEGYLLTGGRLDRFDGWPGAAPITLARDEIALLTASRERQRSVAAARRRRRAVTLTVALVVAALAVALAAIAFASQQRAARGERVAVARALAADSRTQLTDDPDRAVALALAAVDTAREAGEEPLPEAVQALHDAVRQHRLIRSVNHGGFVVRFLGDGQRVLSAGPPGMEPVVWDVETGQAVRTLAGGGVEPTGVAVSPDGRLLAQTYAGQPVRIWDLTTGDVAARLTPPGDGQWRPVFGPDGATLALLDDRGGRWWLSLWDVASGTELASAPAPPQPSATAFHPSGDVVVVAAATSSVVSRYDAATAEPLEPLGREQPERGVSSVAFLPDGRLAIYLRGPSEIVVVDEGQDEPLMTLPVGPDPNTVCVTGDGGAIAATAADEIVRVWDARSGRLVLQLPGSPLGGVLECGPGGSRLASALSNGTVRIWDITPQGAGELLTVATPPTWWTAWAPDGRTVYSIEGDGALVRRDAASGRVVDRAAGLRRDPGARLAVSPDGSVVATTGAPAPQDGPGGVPGGPLSPVVLHDAQDLRRVVRTDLLGWPLAFTADGSKLLVGGPQGSALFDVGSRRVAWRTEQATADAVVHADGEHAIVALLGEPEVHAVALSTGTRTGAVCLAHPPRRLALSPDGATLAVATPSTVEVFDLRPALDGGTAPGCSPTRPDPPGRLASFEANAWLGLDVGPDGRLVTTAGYDGVVGVWDASTGANRLRLEHDAQVGGAGLSPDGDRLLVAVNPAHGHHTLRLYTLDLDRLVELARAIVDR